MNKKYLSVFLFSALMLGTAGTFTSCKDYDDDITNLQGQIDEVKDQVSALKTQIESGAVISNVTSTEDGVTITLSNGSTYTLTNGKDGAAGAPGSVITIDEDGYWCIDGEPTEYKAQGVQGPAGPQGPAGEDGQDGQDGADAPIIYYVPGTTGAEEGYWVKVTEAPDGTVTRETTKTAWLPDGTVTAVWDTENGYLHLYNVVDSEGKVQNVSIQLNATLSSLVFIPQVYVEGVEGLTYGSFKYDALGVTSKDSQTETWTGGAATVVNPKIIAYYHVNPANADVEYIKEHASIIFDDVKYVTRTASSADFNIKIANIEKVANSDSLKVELDVTGTAADLDPDAMLSVFALQVEGDGEEIGTITSDYAAVYKQDMADLAIAAPKGTYENVNDAHYRTDLDAVDTKAYNQEKVWDAAGADGTALSTCDLTVLYNGSLDLKKYVVAHEQGESACTEKVADLEALGFTWKFEVLKNYKIGTPVTDQADFVTLADGVLTPRVYSTTGAAAIGRTPIIRVSLMDGDKVVKVAYIKVYIADETTTPVEKQYELTVKNFAYDCDPAAAVVQSTVEAMNVQIYNELGMSKDEFHNTYKYFYDYGAVQTPADLGSCVETTDPETQATHVIEWTMPKNDLWANAGKTLTHRVRYYVGSQDGTTADTTTTYVEIVLHSAVDAIQKTYNITPADFISNYWDAAKTYAKFNVAVPQSTSDSDPAHCTFVNDLNSPFTTWPANSTEGIPGVLKLDKAVTAIKYIFNEAIENVKKIGDVNVTFDVRNNGLQLWATVGSATEMVAEINNTTTVGATPNTVTYNKSSEVAKQLLNTGEMFAYISATGEVCEDATKVVNITFNNKPYYQANFIRPVNIATKAADNFIDGVDFGEKGSFIRLEDLINPSDWRGRAFSQYTNYWDYYGPFTIKADLTSVECDLNGKRGALPTTVELNTKEVSAGETTVTMGTGADAKTSKYGFITYRNNGTTVNEPFNIYVKVTVEYGWGEIVTDYITVPVATTIGQD